MKLIGCLISYTHHNCRYKSLFKRKMACEHERVTLSSGKYIVIEAIRKVHLKMHNGIVRKFRDVNTYLR